MLGMDDNPCFDAGDTLVASATETFGFDFSGTPNPPNTDPYPLANLFLRVDAVGSISRLEIAGDRKFGIDTLEFGLTPSPVPLPAALPLFVSGICGLGLIAWCKKRKTALSA
jgi:hypothetical protein